MIMNAKYLFVFLAVLSLASVTYAVRIDVGEVSPQPVSPGGDLTVRAVYTNPASTSESITATLGLNYPFTLKTSDTPNTFDLCALCSRTATYFLTVDPGAQSGTYPIFIKTGDTSRTVNVSISGVPNLVLFANTLANITPAQRFELPVIVKNIGTGTAQEIKISSHSSDFVILGGSTVVVNRIQPQDSSVVLFQIVADDQLTPGGYNIPFEMSYKDDLGTVHSSNQSIGVELINSGLLSVQSIKSAATATGQQSVAGQPSTVVVRFQNVGHGDVDYIESNIDCGGQTDKSFLGQLKKDEDAPAVFSLTFPNGGKQQCSVSTVYLDDLGSHTLNTNFTVNVQYPPFPVWIIILIVLAVGYYLYRRRKQHQHHAVKKGQ